MKPIIIEKHGAGSIILPGIDEKKATEEIISGIIRYIKKSLGNGIVIGLSGGVDSSLTAVLCKKAMNEIDGSFYALIMPSEENTADDEQDATGLAVSLGLERKSENDLMISSSGYAVVSIGRIAKCFRGLMPSVFQDVAHENMLSRSRMILLYGLKEALPGTRVAGTGNWDEDSLGYFTKYGDGGVDFLPISMLSKRMVYALAMYNCVPEAIINKKPSAGLRLGQTDEEDLGCTYLQAEVIIRGKEHGDRIVDICQGSSMPEIRAINREMVKSILYRHEKLAQHKLKTPPIMKVTF